jgi:hypothetical protein
VSRRTHRQAQKGQPYAVEWPEWFVECGHPDCEASELLAGQGEAMNTAEAEARAKESAPGWKKVRGLWYCPLHCQGRR